MPCRDMKKPPPAARSIDLPDGKFEIMHLDRGLLESVRAFHAAFWAQGVADRGVT